MAAMFCSSCGSGLDVHGRCERCVVRGASPLRPSESVLDAFAAPTTDASVAAPGALSRFSGMWNWGAFFLCPFWLMNHGGIWLGIGYLVVSLVPFLNLVGLGMAIYFGIKGNDWALMHRRFVDEQQFVAVQNAWRNWGFVIFAIGIVFFVVLIVFDIALIGSGAMMHRARSTPF